MKNRLYIVDKRYYDAITAAFGHGRIMLPSVLCPALSKPVATHPDMILFSPEKGVVICAKEVFAEYSRLLSPYGIRLVQGESHLNSAYPEDIAYNVLNTPAGAFARFDKTDRQIVLALQTRNKRMHSVKQGYARCSSVSFGNALVTADTTIAKAGRLAGLSVLTIRPGFVSLPGYDYGFLGGASGIIDGDTVAFSGDLDTHPDGEVIRSFIRKNGFQIAEIPGLPLTDVGTIFCIDL